MYFLTYTCMCMCAYVCMYVCMYVYEIKKRKNIKRVNLFIYDNIIMLRFGYLLNHLQSRLELKQNQMEFSF